ncbi:hypothetical protein Acsp04_04850 [Actinomadura sp. NBRC 104425]|uniref:hypothetical protein n=1 Tax=Actinomadura sp. NBRC 104425 TaxID=3032204 RepID=UPI00249FC135|nr:hypothetical protein [Actinomadura sp. NBRC 104425]GLZ10250.1 hypothetical protein Acsp04_04850 [Actinomadura sp. NBRC 104425]
MSGVSDRRPESFSPALAWVVVLASLAFAVFGLGQAVREDRAADRAAAGDGRAGAFVAESRSCGRGGCFWYGTFTPDGAPQDGTSGVRLRGVDADAVARGDRVPALDVGAHDSVYAADGSPERGEAVSALVFGLVFGAIGLVGAAVLALRTPWAELPGRLRAFDPADALRSRARELFTADRWGWSAWGPSAVPVKIVRAPARTCGWALAYPFVLPAAIGSAWAGSELLLHDDPAGFDELLFNLFLAAALAVPVTLAVQIGRMLLLRPRLRVLDDEIVIRDGVLLWKAARIRRADIAAVRATGESSGAYLGADGHAELTPFREPLNLDLLLRTGVRLPGRRRRWGNWIWLIHPGMDRRLADRPLLPRRGERYRRISLRVSDPERVAGDLRRWLGVPETPPRQPGFEPADHFLHGRRAVHTGTGDRSITIKETSPQPVLAEIANDGAARLRVLAGRTGLRPGAPPTSVPGGASARFVVDGGARLRVKAAGAWTVAFGDAETARAFDRTISGRGCDVVGYEGPPGIGILTEGGADEVLLRGPDLTLRHSVGQVVPVERRGPQPAALASVCSFAVPTGAVLEVRADGDWTIEILPLRQIPDTPDLLVGPGADHVHPFGASSVQGAHPAVLLYTGPSARLETSFLGKGGFTVHRLTEGLAPADDDGAPIDLQPWTLLQVGTSGSGRWRLRAAITAGTDRHTESGLEEGAPAR